MRREEDKGGDSDSNSNSSFQADRGLEKVSSENTALHGKTVEDMDTALKARPSCGDFTRTAAEDLIRSAAKRLPVRSHVFQRFGNRTRNGKVLSSVS